jgi:katanin p80 WD40 repeat-containing subunit B1
VGCDAMKLILKNFGSVIKSNIDSGVTHGVDISREERYWIIYVFDYFCN